MWPIGPMMSNQSVSRALIAAAAGRRKAGRWERGTVDIGNLSNIDGWRVAMVQAGVIIDTAEKAKHYEAGNGITSRVRAIRLVLDVLRQGWCRRRGRGKPTFHRVKRQTPWKQCLCKGSQTRPELLSVRCHLETHKA